VPLDTGLERTIAYFDRLLAGDGKQSSVMKLRA